MTLAVLLGMFAAGGGTTAMKCDAATILMATALGGLGGDMVAKAQAAEEAEAAAKKASEQAAAELRASAKQAAAEQAEQRAAADAEARAKAAADAQARAKAEAERRSNLGSLGRAHEDAQQTYAESRSNGDSKFEALRKAAQAAAKAF